MYADTHIAIKIKGTIKYLFSWNLKSNIVGDQQRKNRFSVCKANIPVPVIVLSILVSLFPPCRAKSLFGRKKAKMLKGTFNMIDSVVQESQEVNLMINFPLQFKLNLNISLSCLQVYSLVKDWICNQLWAFRTTFWAEWISKYLQPDRLMYVSRKAAACLIHCFSLLHFAYFIVPDFFLEDRNARLN